MNPAELPLRDIHLPDPISWWPLALGWWLLLLALATPFILWGILKLWRTVQQRYALKRAALIEFKRIENTFSDNQNELELMQSLSTLLRRCCISHYSRAATASLTGEQWLSLLDQYVDNHDFSQGPGRSLISGPYQKNISIDSDALLTLCKQWIKRLPNTLEAKHDPV